MTTDVMALEIEVLTQAEAAKIWKTQGKRAANYGEFLAFLNTHDVGATFDVKVKPGEQNAEHARVIKHNFTEAARERTRVVYSDGQPTTPIQGIAADQFKPNGDGKWWAEVPAPVLLRWKTTKHDEKRTVQDGKKSAEITVSIIDKIHGLIVATDAIKKRGPRAETTDVTALVTAPPANAKAGATVALADGRTATLSKAGKWRAPVAATTAADHAAVQGTSQNGLTDVPAGNNADAASQTEAVGAPA